MSRPTPQAGQQDVDALRSENEQLRLELERVRASTSYRLGNAVVRGARRVLSGRRGRRPGTDAGSAVGVAPTPSAPNPPSGTGSTPAPSTREAGQPPVEVASADDLLVQAGELPASALPDLVRLMRTEMPPHASLVIGHDDPGPLETDDATRLLPPEHARRVGRAFGPARNLRVLDVDGALKVVAGRPRRLVPPVEQLDDPADGLPEGPIFIGGTGRSGTWALGHMLGAHPRWCTIPSELRFHARPRGFPAVLAGRVSPERFAEEFERRWYVPSQATGRPKGVERLVGLPVLRWHLDAFVDRARHDVPAALGQLLLDVVGPFVAERTALGWVETTPDNAQAAAALTTVFPTARVVHAVRDGRDVAASVATMPWGPDTIEEALVWWAERVRWADEAARRATPDRVHVLRLEELLYLERDRAFDDLVAFAGFADDRRIRRHFDQEMDGSRGSLGRWRSQVEAGKRDRIDARYRELLAELREVGVGARPADPDAVDELIASR